jgi:hypothetical protein
LSTWRVAGIYARRNGGARSIEGVGFVEVCRYISLEPPEDPAADTETPHPRKGPMTCCGYYPS